MLWPRSIMCIAARCARRWPRRCRRSGRSPERVSPALGPWTVIIRAWLVADRDVPRKQRHTARRVWQRLVGEYGAEVAESTVRAFVAQVNFELDNTLRVVTVPQTHGPGEEARVRFRGVRGLDRRGVGEVLDVLSAVVVIRGGGSMWRFAIRPRRRSSRATCWRSRISAGCRPGSATTT